MAKSRVYKKIAQLQLDDRCDGTDKVSELALSVGLCKTYLVQNTKLGTTRLREDVREALRLKLRVSKAVMDEHFKQAKRVNKEECND